MFRRNWTGQVRLTRATILLMAGLGILNSCSQSKTESADSLGWNKKIAQTVIHAEAVSLGQLLKNITNKTEQIELIRMAIDSVRFYEDHSGYFYVYQYDCVNVAHATQKDLPGKNLYNHQDTHDKFVIRELSAAAANGGGFVEFYWLKPGTTGEKQKMGYVEPIPGTDYFIGTGVYLE